MAERRKISLSRASEEKLLKTRICDLPISIEGSWLSDCVGELHQELDAKGINFKPDCYLADEWLTPDLEPIIGIPFFLVHPALMRLEKKFMLDVEGGTKPWCMKLLRHEAGHALNYAYKLYKRKKWQKVFGKFSKEYGDTYRFRPYSKNFVKHLEDYYAQYHPDEDFAETFAVWVTPGIDWQTQYKGWKAQEKLRYVDDLMKDIGNKEPVVKRGKKYWEASRMKITLGKFYDKKRRDYAEDFPDFHDSNLKRMFVSVGDVDVSSATECIHAADIIKKYRKNIRDSVSSWTGEKKYIIDDLIKKIMQRCKELKLVTCEDESIAVIRMSTYIAALIMNYVHTGWFGGDK